MAVQDSRRRLHDFFTSAAQPVHAGVGNVPGAGNTAPTSGGVAVQNTEPSQKFRDMSFAGKLVFLGKVVIFFASFGFAFPLIFND
jgi:hypothetical protein